LAHSPMPFARFEWLIAWRYLRARREHGGAALISVISFVGIALAVTALIVIMSIMSGFRTTLLDTLLNGSGQVFVKVDQYQDAESDEIAKLIRTVDSVRAVHGIHEGQVLVTNGDRATGALVRGVKLEDFDLYKFREGRGGREQFERAGYGEGKNGGNVIAMGVYIANELGVVPGMRVTLTGAKGANTPFGNAQPTQKEYIVGSVFQTGNAELDAAYIFMPRRQAELFFRLSSGYTQLDVRLDDPMVVQPAIEGDDADRHAGSGRNHSAEYHYWRCYAGEEQDTGHCDPANNRSRTRLCDARLCDGRRCAWIFRRCIRIIARRCDRTEHWRSGSIPEFRHSRGRADI